MRPKLIVFDALASFALVDLNKPEVADFTMSLFATLADESGACVLVTHHLYKTKDNISTPEQARVLVRGSTALVDRTRATYVLWSLGESKGKEICSAINEEWAREKVYNGCLAKENFGGDKSIKTFVRQPNGLLVVKNAALTASVPGQNIQLKADMVQAIAEAAENGQPYSKTGANGVYEQRATLPSSLRDMCKRKLWDLIDALLNAGEVVLCIAPGSTTKNKLDVPTGPFAQGISRVQPGALV